jgi:hypothetical protein
MVVDDDQGHCVLYYNTMDELKIKNAEKIKEIIFQDSQCFNMKGIIIIGLFASSMITSLEEAKNTNHD